MQNPAITQSLRVLQNRASDGARAALQILDSTLAMTDVRDIELLSARFLDALWALASPQLLAIVTMSDAGAVRRMLLRSQSETKRLSTHDGFPSGVEALAKEAHALNTPTLREHAGIYWLVLPRTGTLIRRECIVIASRSPRIEDQLPLGRLIKLYQNLLEMLEEGQHDKLTGLLNRKTFNDQALRILAEVGNRPPAPLADRRQNSGQEYWLAILDIDHFKNINDTFGHMYGDEVLVLFSRLMRENFREDDLLFRFGGEEFVVVMKVADRKGAVTALERFRAAVQGYRFPQVGVTVSIGAIQIEAPTPPPEIVGRADEALYEAKRSGRNQVRFYADLVNKKQVAQVEGSIDLF